MSDITSVDTLVSATLHEKSKWLWELHERLAALEVRPNPVASDPYELAAHWRDKAGEALNRAEKAEAAASQAIDERDVWVRDCKAAEARAERVERHDKAMSEEVVRLRKLVDANQAAADTLERLRKGEIVEGKLLRDTSTGTACEEHARLSAKAEAERDALAVKLQAELANKSDLQARVAELERALPRGTIAGDEWIGVPSSELAALRRDAERWRWLKSHAEWRCRDCCGQMEWTVATPDSGNLNEDVDAAIAAEKEVKG